MASQSFVLLIDDWANPVGYFIFRFLLIDDWANFFGFLSKHSGGQSPLLGGVGKMPV